MSKPSIPVVSLTPVGRNPDRSPWYEFSTSFPSKNVRALPEAYPTPEAAFEAGKKYIAQYQAQNFPGGMGEVIGVTQRSGSYHPVVNTYYSGS